MKKRLRNIVLQFKKELRENMTLGQKIRIYMLMVAFVTVVIGVVFLVVTGAWSNEKKTIQSHIRYELATTGSRLEDEINSYKKVEEGVLRYDSKRNILVVEREMSICLGS